MGRRCGSSGASSGTGKSRWVAAIWPDAFWKAPESKWWDGYSGQETVVLDDFKDYAMPPGRATAPPGLVSSLGRGQGRQCAHAGQEVCPYGEYFARGLVLKADVHRTIWRRVTDFAAKHGRLIHCMDGWTPLRPGLRGLRFLVILSPKARNSPARPRRGYRPSDCQLALRLSELLIILPISAAASGVSRVPRTCYGFCVRRVGGDYPWYAQSPLGLRSVTHTLAAKARLMP